MENIRPIPVSNLSEYLRAIIDAEEMLMNIRIVGEIADFVVRKNICYFGLKDDAAYLSCVCFNSNFIKLLENGAKVVLTGSPKFYVKGGRLNFQVNIVEPLGQGDAYLEFIKLKEKLEEKGYFKPENKKLLPKIIKNVGVVTSLEGAVIKDICSVIKRRNPFINIHIVDSGVQGNNAIKQVVSGLTLLDECNFDVIILARGGGSLEDLSVFNSESVADCIYNLKTPIISAVGHETDFTISDFVADVRAATPSVAAELVARNVLDSFENLNRAFKKVTNLITYVIENKKELLVRNSNELSSYAKLAVSEKNRELALIRKNLTDISKKLMVEYYHKLDIYIEKLEKLNPLLTLKRGYGKIVKAGKDVEFNEVFENDDIDVIMNGGILKAKVISKIIKERN